MKNKAILVGRVGQAPEIKNFDNGKLCRFSLATTEYWNDRNTKERREVTEWHRIEVWTPATVDYLAKNLQKGSLVMVEGKITYETYTDKGGVKQNSTIIRVSSPGSGVNILSGKTESGNDRKPAESTRKNAGPAGAGTVAAGFENNDEDLPNPTNFFNDGDEDDQITF